MPEPPKWRAVSKDTPEMAEPLGPPGCEERGATRPSRAASPPAFPGGAGRLVSPAPWPPPSVCAPGRARRFWAVSPPGPLSPDLQQWALRDSNPRPAGCKPAALTN